MAFVASISFCARPSASSAVSTFSGGALRWTVAKPRAVTRMNMDTIKVRIAEEVKKAQEATAKFGKNSKEAALAWDVVEELEAEASHMKAKETPKDPLEEFCAEAPEADECRVYED